jgi:hypothetical protein
MGIDDERTDDEKEQDKRSISAHYGWLYLLHQLGESPVLQITGHKCITEINTIFAFNYLAMLAEIQLEKNEQIRSIHNGKQY